MWNMSESVDDNSDPYSRSTNLSDPPVPKRRPGIKRTTGSNDNSFAYRDTDEMRFKVNSSMSPKQRTCKRRDVNRSNISSKSINSKSSGGEDEDEDEEEDEEEDDSEREERKRRGSGRSPYYKPEKSSPAQNLSFSHGKTLDPPKDPWTFTFGIIWMIVFIACITVFYPIMNQGTTAPNKKDHYDLHQLAENIRETFHNQEFHIWNDILSEIDEVITYGNKPSIIILFANEGSTVNCLAQKLGKMSSEALGSNNYLYLTPRDFGDDLGDIILRLKSEIPPKKVVVIKDLLEINPTAIKVFHVLCDRENPLVKEAVYIITIIAEGYQPQQKKVEFIEELITEKYSNAIDTDILLPLVTRITDGTIVSVKPELNVNICPLV